jgi:hypothetical protein
VRTVWSASAARGVGVAAGPQSTEMRVACLPGRRLSQNASYNYHSPQETAGPPRLVLLIGSRIPPRTGALSQCDGDRMDARTLARPRIPARFQAKTSSEAFQSTRATPERLPGMIQCACARARVCRESQSQSQSTRRGHDVEVRCATPLKHALGRHPYQRARGACQGFRRRWSWACPSPRQPPRPPRRGAPIRLRAQRRPAH